MILAVRIFKNVSRETFSFFICFFTRLCYIIEQTFAKPLVLVFKGTSGNTAADRLVGIFSPIEDKSAVNTMCICEHFGEEWGKKTCQYGRWWVFGGALITKK